MSQKKGNYVIKNAEGSVVLQGLAALVNDVNNIDWNDATEITEHRDAGNVPRTLTKDFNEERLTLRLIVGVGYAFSDQAALKAAIASLAKCGQIITSGFEDAQCNWADAAKAIIWEVGKTLAQGELMAVNITARKLSTTAAAAIDFTGAWADL
jgi:hypothetical protein